MPAPQNIFPILVAIAKRLAILAPMKPAAHTFSPWLVKQRPCGDWVVDQLVRPTILTRRFGPFKTEAEARGVHQDLTVKKPTP